MHRITGTIIASAALLAFAGAAHAGNEGSYALMPTPTETIGANYVAPATTYLPQPTEVITQPMATETMTTGTEVMSGSDGGSSYTINSEGVIIFHDAPKSN